MKSLALSTALLAAALAPGLAAGASAEHAHAAPAAIDTRLALRDLWVEHVFWVRNYVVANQAQDRKAKEAAAQEVVANAKQIAAAIEPFYGKAASDQLLTLLAGHWGAIKDVADGKPRDKATAALVANAKAIAKFLSGANPHLPYDALVGLLSAHGAHHVTQIDQVQAGDFGGEAKTWAAMRQHMFVIADALTQALAKQFPGKV